MARKRRKTQPVDADRVLREYYENSKVSGEVEAEVAEEVAEREQSAGTQALQERLKQHTDRSPELSAGDLDAAWDRADVGEETVSGSNPTPDQDIVEEIGEALGVTYQDQEPLAMDEKISKRDDQRWELDPASSEDYLERHERPERKS